MKKYYVLTALIIGIFSFSACEKAQQILDATGLSNDEVIQGLKSALNVGSDTSVTTLSKVDGYFKDQAVKILLPEEAQPVYNVINSIPGGSILLDNAIQSINRAAEDAAPEAKVIFTDAITGITIADGFSILNGGDTAATVYLNSKTYQPLTQVFQPKIDASLAKPLLFNTSASESYTKLLNAYNTASLGGILYPEIKTNSLSEHVTKKALDGLFIKVAAEEKKIRQDPLHQVSDILKKVFGG
ncbi:MAG: hypothetical protein CFE21_12425 [Bacteroidetes bacterium B1(2017)]|nr:MAG: hypothetical protein CFE21_12425 [Bacteroidetes bacterium B1(2017)]